ncbi:hypothetical protein O7631_26035 [Micromonospora sp. WMMD967]|uniref:hypothetical protein n=1 Tax=Micromonospora sp. WMMD967 TaxID=3016101 RepID=UPI002415D1E6|nr:hypothetical protein [Micromonospora sp. WMMD967]MDG4840005.1 hypothetical protein [Micromonospora sp. WMMD967]
MDTNRPEASIITVALVQTAHAAAETTVVLSATGGLASDRVAMSISQARVLRYRLGGLIDAAGHGNA